MDRGAFVSYRPHPTKGTGHWYITIERRELDPKTNKKVRRQVNIPFRGSEAEAAAYDAEHNGKTAATQFPTILDLLPRFLTAYQNNSQGGTYSDLQYALKRLLPYFGEMRIPLLMPHHFEEYKSKRLTDTYLPGKPAQDPALDTPEETAKRRTVGKRTINRELTYLKSILTYAEEQHIDVRYRPKLFPKKQTGGRATIPLSPDEISAVLENLQGHQKTLAMLMFWGGLRRAEACNLCCEDIDLQNDIMLIKGKGGAIQPVPLFAELKQHLEKAKGDRKSGWLCANPKTGKPYNSIMKSLRTACEKAGCSKHVYHHLLRHTTGTSMMIAGVQQRAIQGMLRHADIKTTGIYTHLAGQFLQDEGTKLSGLISGRKRAENTNKNETL